MTERSQPIEIKHEDRLNTLSWSPDGKHLIRGGESIGVWRVEDGQRRAKMTGGYFQSFLCLAVSQDGRWIAAGAGWGYVFIWDAQTYETVLSHKVSILDPVCTVDFSPDATRLVFSCAFAATIWDVANRKPVLPPLRHDNVVGATKYTAQGDYIATATPSFVRIWNNCGNLFVVIDVRVTPCNNRGLLWFNDHILVVSNSTIKQFDAADGSLVCECPVPSTTSLASCIALPVHGQFIAYATRRTITFWDMLTQARLARIESPEDVYSLAFSPDGRCLAIGERRKTTIKNLKDILSPPYTSLFISISDSVLRPFKHDQFTKTGASLLAAIALSAQEDHITLANKALVLAWLQCWKLAINDAKSSIEVRPSVIGYIAQSVALIGEGRKAEGCQAFDLAYVCCDPNDLDFLNLIKAVVLFMAGKHDDALSRIGILAATVAIESVCLMVEACAQMLHLLGNLHMERSNYETAIHSLERAQGRITNYTSMSRSVFVISLVSGWNFHNIGITIRRRLCEALYAAGRARDAVERFHQMSSEMNLHDACREWALDFSLRSLDKLEHLGDVAAGVKQYGEAVVQYSAALSLEPRCPRDILLKRSKAFVAMGSCQQALDDANQVIALDSSSPWGYETKHAALHGAGDYDKAVDVFKTMLSKIEESADADVLQHSDRYINPSQTCESVRRIVQRTIRRLPRVLVNVTNGRLHDRTQQGSSFESSPVFNQLLSSMTTRIDCARIRREVRQYFRYVMLSHKWEENEPLYHEIVHVSVYDLGRSQTHDKLQTFCKIVRDAGFVWAWSDTCCIDKSDHFVLQEALVAMFRWYQGSALAIVFLRGVRPSSPCGALVRSVWNTRAWTLQEYVAAKTVHFYTEDWTLYLDLKLPNHKEAPEIISEMEQATGVPAEQLMVLRPGLTSIREKLRLASTRQTTLAEDVAYSLLGIFSVAGLPAIYGEGDASLGRLLANVLTRSGDTSILAWTGESGHFNSCLPARIAVFNESATSHLPTRTVGAEMDRTITVSHAVLFDSSEALTLYDRLNALPTPRFAESRLTLPCVAFQLPALSSSRAAQGRAYRADTDAFGVVDIRTRHDLSRMQMLYLVCPWLDALLEHDDVQSGPFVQGYEELFSDDEIDGWVDDEPAASLPRTEWLSPLTPVHTNRETRARRLAMRLQRPFGALLVTPAATGRRATDYVRVASDTLIRVQFRENVTLADILDNVRVLDVL